MTLSKESVCVVTGAASGIGRALALRLAQEKVAGIAVSDVNQKGLDETAEMVANLGVKCTKHLVDVSKREQMQQFAENVVAEHGKVTHLINNAGVALYGRVEEVSLDDIEWLMSINFWGVVYGTKIFLPLLRRAKQAHIINISSIFGIIAPPGQAAYCASKFAVRGFTETLRHELKGSNIAVSCVHPGGIKTNIANASKIGASAKNDEKRRELVKEFNEKMTPTSPEKAAEIIVRGIKNKNPRIFVGNDAKLINLVARIFPVSYAAVLNFLSGGKLERT